jgi:hypothetical protein
MPDTRHPSRGALSGIKDARVRDHIRDLWQHFDVSLGRVGQDRHITAAELEAIKRTLAAHEKTLDKGYRTTTLGGDAGGGSSAAAGGGDTDSVIDAPYVTALADARLTQHRRMIAGDANVIVTDAGALGDITVDARPVAIMGSRFVRVGMPASFTSWVGSTSAAQPWSGSVTMTFSQTQMGQMPRVGTGTGNVANALDFDSGVDNSGLQMWRGTSGYGGFYNRIIFGVELAGSPDMQFAVGLRNNIVSPVAGDVVSDFVDVVMVGCDAGEASMSIMHNDAAGACTKVPLGSGFPSRTTGEIYVFDIWCDPSDTTMSYKIRRVSTGSVTGAISSELPTDTTFLTPFCFVDNGPTALACRISIMFIGNSYPYAVPVL